MVGRGEFMDVYEAWIRGKSISEIARLSGRDRKTIRRLLRENGPRPRTPRELSSKLDRTASTCLLGEDPVSNAEVLFDEIRAMGYVGGRTILKEFLHPFRDLVKRDLVKERTTLRSGPHPATHDSRRRRRQSVTPPRLSGRLSN